MSGTTWPTAEPKLQFIGQRQPLTPRRCAPGLAPGLSTQVLGYDYPTLDPSADPLVRQFWAREAAWVAEVGRRSHQSAFCSNKTGAGLLARLRLIDTCSHAQELSVRRQQRKFPFRAFVLRDGVIGPGTLTLTLTLNLNLTLTLIITLTITLTIKRTRIRTRSRSRSRAQARTLTLTLTLSPSP